MIIALVLFTLDTLFLLGVVFAFGELDGSAMFELAFHAWVMFYLISGVKASAQLKKMPQTPSGPLPQQYWQPGAPDDPSIAKRPESLDGSVILEHHYSNLKITVKRTQYCVELSVNGMVYSDNSNDSRSDYVLIAIVDNIRIDAVMDSSVSNMHLYINGEINASVVVS